MLRVLSISELVGPGAWVLTFCTVQKSLSEAKTALVPEQ